jgi:hypothetical protein
LIVLWYTDNFSLIVLFVALSDLRQDEMRQNY